MNRFPWMVNLAVLVAVSAVVLRATEARQVPRPVPKPHVKNGTAIHTPRGGGEVYKSPMPRAVKEAIEADLARASAKIKYARSLFEAGKNAEAKAACQEAFNLAPKFNGKPFAPDTKQLMGDIHYAEGNYKQALYWFGDRAKNTKDDQQDFDIALCYVRMGDYQEAKRHYSHQLVFRNSSLTKEVDLPVIRDLKSLEASILLARGLDYYVTSNQEKASEYYDAAALLAPSNPWLMHQRAVIAWRKGRREESLDLFRKVAVLSDSPRIVGDARRYVGGDQIDALRAARGRAN